MQYCNIFAHKRIGNQFKKYANYPARLDDKRAYRTGLTPLPTNHRRQTANIQLTTILLQCLHRNFFLFSKTTFKCRTTRWAKIGDYTAAQKTFCFICVIDLIFNLILNLRLSFSAVLENFAAIYPSFDFATERWYSFFSHWRNKIH